MSFAVVKVDVTPMARLFKALGDQTRLRMVALLAHAELCVCHVETALGLSQPNASRHFAILKAAGIVEHRRDQSWVYYRLARQRDAECERQLDALVRAFGKQALVRDDVVRLLKARGPGACK